MNKEFLNTIFNEQPHDIEGAEAALRYLIKTVLETNKMIGMDHTDRDKWLPIYYKLRVEEGSELITAIDNENAVEVVDAILDTLVVGCYEVFVNDATKSHTIDCNTLTGIVEDLERNLDDCTLWQDFMDFKRWLKLQHSAASVYACAVSLFARLNIDHMKAVKEVTDSNLSKFPTLDELGNATVTPALDDYTEIEDIILCTQQHEIEQEGRYSGVTAEAVTNESGETRYVFWTAKEYGEPKVKYVKPCTFCEPDFASCILEK